MNDDPRQVLDEAARRRLGCQVMRRGGPWVTARFVRVDKAGVILTAPGLHGGEDLKVWFSVDDVPYSFDASVLRAGVPVPDRSADGVMLGFIDHFKRAAGEAPEAASPPAGARITVLPPQGRGLELLGGEARLVELGVRGVSFSVPQGEPLKFVEGGRVRLRLAAPGLEAQVVEGRVAGVRPTEGHYLYGVEAIEATDESAYMKLVAALRDLG